MAPGCLQSLKFVLFNVEAIDLFIIGVSGYSTIGKRDAENRLVDFDFLIQEI